MPPTAIITDTDSSLPIAPGKEIQYCSSSDHRPVWGGILPGCLRHRQCGRFSHGSTGKANYPPPPPPPPENFVEAFKSAFAAGADQILCLTISSEMSAVYTAARTAAELFTDKTIKVVDSRTVAFGEGLMAIEAAKSIADGASLDEAIAAAVESA